MRFALKSLIVVWIFVVLISLGGLICLSPSYIVVGAFSQALRVRGNPELQHWFYGCGASFVVGIFVTIWLWRTYRQQYGRLWKSD